MQCSLTRRTWLKQTFEEADKNGDGLLNIDEIYQLLHKLNVNLPRRKVKQMFQVRNDVKETIPSCRIVATGISNYHHTGIICYFVTYI